MSARRARALRVVLLASQRAGYAAPRSARAFLLQLRRLVSVAAVAPAVVFVTEHLKAEHAVSALGSAMLRPTEIGIPSEVRRGGAPRRASMASAASVICRGSTPT